MSKTTVLIWVMLVFIGIFYIKWTEKPLLQVTMCDVGQGDAYILSYKSYQMVIDGGPGQKILECLSSVMPLFDRTIEVVLATHPDKDHIGGLQYVLTTYKVDQIITNGKTKQTKTFENFNNAVLESGAPVSMAKKGDRFGFESLQFHVLWPEVEEPKTLMPEKTKNDDLSTKKTSSASAKLDDANASSITLRLEFGDFSALFTGDLEISQEEILVSSGNLEPVDLLKVGHHGSKNSTSPAFLEALHPSMAFIGVGKTNTYGHPTKRVIDLLEENMVKIYRSDLDGQVNLKTDGKSIWKI